MNGIHVCMRHWARIFEEFQEIVSAGVRGREGDTVDFGHLTDKSGKTYIFDASLDTCSLCTPKEGTWQT